MNLSPKTRFLKTDAAKRHLDLVKNPDVEQALETSLAQMVMEAPGSGNPAQSWDRHCQLVGAKEFIRIFLNLAEVSPEPKKIESQLNYNSQ